MINNINVNPISSEWKRRYSEQTADTKERLDALDKMKPKDYQLRLIKKSKIELKDGDVFVLSPRENIFFYGKILKSNIIHIAKDTFVHGKNVVFIFQNKTSNPTIDDFNPDYTKLLVMPAIVDKSYWEKGLFYIVGNNGISDNENNLNYGFYKIGINSNWYCKEDGTVLESKPEILGIYGVSTITGIASQIEKELIINPNFLNFN